MQPTPKACRAQLERILNSSKFVASERMSRFLRFVVEETLAGPAGQIKQYTIAVKALGYDSGFDPQADSAVRMLARRLRRALKRYYESPGINDPILIEIPKGSYVPTFGEFAASTPIAAPGPATGTWEAGVATPSLPTVPSIAVVSLASLGDEEDAYFASGLTEGLIIALSRFPDFLVVGPLSRDRIWKQHLEPRGIGREYGVRFVLDGNVRAHGQTLRIALRLADTSTGGHLWGHAYDYDIQTNSMLQVEDDLAGEVTATVADSFGIIPRILGRESQGRRADSLAAYESVLRFFHYAAVLTDESFLAAEAALQRTLEQDPGHALAAAYLGDLRASSYHLGAHDDLAVLDRAEELGRRAVALDPNCQPARFTMALVHFLRFRPGLVREELESALQLNPNYANYLGAAALLLAMVGDWDRGMELMDRAMRLNPHYPGWYHIVPFLNCYRQDAYDAAYNETQRFNTPGYFWDPLIRAAALGQLGLQAEAEAAVDELLALSPDFPGRGRSLIRRMVFLDEHVEMLLEGLRKAGLENVA